MKRVAVYVIIISSIFVLSAAPHQGSKPKTRSPIYTFRAFPASPDFRGKPHSPQLLTEKSHIYRTQIRNQVKRGPNFAGHFTLAKWGCGSPCLAFVIVDARDGTVFDPGFSIGCADDTDLRAEIQFQLRSRLIIATGFSEQLGCGTSFYEWNGRQLQMIYFKPWNYGHRARRTVDLPRYATDIYQPIPNELKLDGAPNTIRDVDCFRGFTGRNSIFDVARKCGIPDELQGSGTSIFIYDMDDGSVVMVGTTDLKSLMYIDHVAGKKDEALLNETTK